MQKHSRYCWNMLITRNWRKNCSRGCIINKNHVSKNVLQKSSEIIIAIIKYCNHAWWHAQLNHRLNRYLACVLLQLERKTGDTRESPSIKDITWFSVSHNFLLFKVSCGKCRAELGHEFLKDGPNESSRFWIYSETLQFVAAKQAAEQSSVSDKPVKEES